TDRILTLKGELQTHLSQEIRQEIRALGQRTAGLETRVESMVENHNNVVNYSKALQTYTDEVENTLEDLSNHSRRNTLCIRSFPGK
ncbi:Hypothetical predicted protein, partial [Pelobates cultripes]